MKKIILTILLTIPTFFLLSCSPNISPTTYVGSEIGVVSKVRKGIVIATRSVILDNSSGAGGIAGVTAGAAGGSSLGSGASANIMGAVGGALVGGVIGHAVDKAANQHKGVEYIIKLDDGETISIVQLNKLQFKVNQHVLIIYGATTRIVADQHYVSFKK